MKSRNLPRRKIIKMGGTTLALGLSGCIGTQNQNNQQKNLQSSNNQDTTNDDMHGEDDMHGDGGHAGESFEPTDEVSVSMVTTENGHHFEPHIVWVNKGGLVTWVNESGRHTSTAYHPRYNGRPRRIPGDADPWHSGIETEQGASFQKTFDVEGIYDYYCIPHEGVGMIGTIIVGPRDQELHSQHGMMSPQDSLPRGARRKIGDLNHMVEDRMNQNHQD